MNPSFNTPEFPTTEITGCRRRLGDSDLVVSPVGFGCWPIAGVSTLGVNDADSLATIQAALDAGINLIDTAFSYGYAGEADKLLAQILRTRRDEVVLCSKVGMSFDSDKNRVIDGRPTTLLKHAELVLQRLEVEHVDVMYLHVPDPRVPVQESAGALSEIVRRGWTRHVGLSNVNTEQLAKFHAECPVMVVQPPFNMLQQQAVEEISAFCESHKLSLVCYWALMKGLLAGKLKRDHQFDPQDKRLTYPIYQGRAWQQSQDLLDKLRGLSTELGCTVAQLVVAWTIHHPSISVALCGAKRPSQIRETAQAMFLELDDATRQTIDGWIAEISA
jgi:aryl-alcohol dehydrogenase-like predicted oxidoreductase